MTFINKKAAMFGLDARIALAIFGALSVISGAALYSAIQQAKVIALQTELSEIGKAIEQYILDTGTDISLDPSGLNYDGITLNFSEEMLSSSKKGWQGPYLSFDRRDNTSLTHFAHSKYNRIAADRRTSYEDGFSKCSDINNTGKPCYYWIFYGDVPNDVIKALDLSVDGESGLTKDRVISTGSKKLCYRASLSLTQY